MAKRLTKAERIFIDTKIECRKLLDSKGMRYTPEGYVVAFNRVCVDFPVYKRTLNEAYQKTWKSIHNLEVDRENGIVTIEEYEHERNVILMVFQTILNTREGGHVI